MNKGYFFSCNANGAPTHRLIFAMKFQQPFVVPKKHNVLYPTVIVSCFVNGALFRGGAPTCVGFIIIC